MAGQGGVVGVDERIGCRCIHNDRNGRKTATVVEAHKGDENHNGKLGVSHLLSPPPFPALPLSRKPKLKLIDADDGAACERVRTSEANEEQRDTSFVQVNAPFSFASMRIERGRRGRGGVRCTEAIKRVHMFVTVHLTSRGAVSVRSCRLHTERAIPAGMEGVFHARAYIRVYMLVSVHTDKGAGQPNPPSVLSHPVWRRREGGGSRGWAKRVVEALKVKSARDKGAIRPPQPFCQHGRSKNGRRNACCASAGPREESATAPPISSRCYAPRTLLQRCVKGTEHE